jgi:hypothetical protein
MISRSYNPACEHRRFQSDRKGIFFHDRRLGSQKIDARPGGLETCLNNTQVAALVSNMTQPANPRRNLEETSPLLHSWRQIPTDLPGPLPPVFRLPRHRFQKFRLRRLLLWFGQRGEGTMVECIGG